jgi:hypothetical protein
MNAELRVFVDGVEQSRRTTALPASFSAGDQICVAGQNVLIVDVVHHVSRDTFTVDVHASARDNPREGELLIDDLLRYHVLMRVFDGDVSRWLEFLESDASAEQVATDAEFVASLSGQLCRDPSLLERIRELVDTSGQLLFGFAESAAN